MDESPVIIMTTLPQQENSAPPLIDREEEKRQELQALKEILLKKHRKSTPPVRKSALKQESVKEQAAKASAKNPVDTAIPFTVATTKSNNNNSMTLDTTTKNSILASKATSSKTKKPETLTLKQHKLLRSLQKHKSTSSSSPRATKGYMNPVSKKNVWGDMVTMIASEIVFACTPVMNDEQDQQEDDGHVMVCSTLHKTCGGKEQGVQEEVEELVVAQEEEEKATVDSKSKVVDTTTPKEINIDYMPKFKASNIPKMVDDNTTFTTVSSADRKKALQQRLKQLKEKKTQDSYDLGTNSIVTKSTHDGSKSNSSVKETFLKSRSMSPPVDTAKKTTSSSSSVKKLIGKATADSPILLLSDSVEHLILDAGNNTAKTTPKSNGNGNKIPKTSSNASSNDDVLRLMSSSAASDHNKKQQTEVNHDDASKEYHYYTDTTDDGDTTTDLDTWTDDEATDDEDMADLEQKMLMHVRLAQQMRKRKQLHKKLSAIKQQQKAKEDLRKSQAMVVEKSGSRDPPSAETNIIKSPNASGHTHWTMATAKHVNTSPIFVEESTDRSPRDPLGKVASSSEDIISVDDDDSTVYYPKDDHAERESPLDAEDLYNSTYRKEKRRKDLEEMKQILSNNQNARSIGSRSYYGLSNEAGSVNGQNVFDLQRASNQAAMHALRMRQMDVVRLQLENEDESYMSRMR